MDNITKITPIHLVPEKNASEFNDFGLTFSNCDELARNAKAPDYLINGILESNTHGILAGASMAYKTFVALAMAHSICTGSDFMGNKTYATGKVMFVTGEGKSAFARRVRAQQIVNGDFNDNLLELNESISIDNPQQMAQLKQAIAKIKPVLVIFDTFASLVNDTDENSPSHVGRTLRLIRETCDNDFTSSMIIHHHGKDASRGMRGASNFKNDVGFAMELNRQPNSMITTMSCGKMKDGEDFKDIHMVANVVELGLIRQDGTDSTSLVLSQSNYVPPTKAAKPLSPNELNALSTLRKIMPDKGTSPPNMIVEYFDIQPENAPKLVIPLGQWRTDTSDKMTVNGQTKDAKRKAFDRAYAKLYTLGYIGYYGDYAWLVDKFTTSDTLDGLDKNSILSDLSDLDGLDTIL